MKKWLVISFLLFACLSIVYSWTDLIVDENLNPSTEGFNITAFKEGTTPRFYIRLYSGISTDGRTLFEKDSSGQDSSLSVYDVSAIIKNTSKIDDALILEIGTNYKRDILISVTFYPFVRVSDPNQSTVDAVYSFNGNNAADKGSLTATYRGGGVHVFIRDMQSRWQWEWRRNRILSWRYYAGAQERCFGKTRKQKRNTSYERRINTSGNRREPACFQMPFCNQEHKHE